MVATGLIPAKEGGIRLGVSSPGSWSVPVGRAQQQGADGLHRKSCDDLHGQARYAGFLVGVRG
jgi:hypothetical protein